MAIRNKKYRKHEVDHSRDRGVERYGIRLTNNDFKEIAKTVMSPNRNNKVFMHQQDDGCSLWLVKYKDTVFRLVFDEHTRAVRTLLDMRPVDHELWRNTHDKDGKPTLGDIVRIKKMKLK